nr:hypothetical protein [Tanacetum cinerariifolium]
RILADIKDEDPITIPLEDLVTLVVGVATLAVVKIIAVGKLPLAVATTREISVLAVATDRLAMVTDIIKRDKIQAKPDKTEHKTESMEKSTVKSQQKVKPDNIEAKKTKKSKENKVDGLNLPFSKVIYKRG